MSSSTITAAGQSSQVGQIVGSFSDGTTSRLLQVRNSTLPPASTCRAPSSRWPSGQQRQPRSSASSAMTRHVPRLPAGKPLAHHHPIDAPDSTRTPVTSGINKAKLRSQAFRDNGPRHFHGFLQKHQWHLHSLRRPGGDGDRRPRRSTNHGQIVGGIFVARTASTQRFPVESWLPAGHEWHVHPDRCPDRHQHQGLRDQRQEGRG